MSNYWKFPQYYSQQIGMLFFFNNPFPSNDWVTNLDVKWLINPQFELRKMADQLAHNPIAEGEQLGKTDNNKNPFASIWYKFLLIMLCVTITIRLISGLIKRLVTGTN